MIPDSNTPAMIDALRTAMRYISAHPDSDSPAIVGDLCGAIYNLEAAKNTPVFVTLSDTGINVLDETGTELPNIYHIDYNLLDVSDECPVCGDPVGDEEICKTCGFNWAIGGEDEDTRAITAATAYHKAKKGIRQ